MNIRTIGCVELNSIATGMLVADAMVKAATVQLVLARPTCPGRYLVIVCGDTGSVLNSVSVGRSMGGSLVVDWFTLPNVHASVIPALSGTTIRSRIDALGIIETATTASCILAADAAVKAAAVDLLEIRFAAGLGGKGFMVMTGDVGAINAAVVAGVAGVGEGGPVLSHVVIASPCEELKAQLF